MNYVLDHSPSLNKKGDFYLRILLKVKQTTGPDSHPLSDSAADELLVGQGLIYSTPICCKFQPLSLLTHSLWQ